MSDALGEFILDVHRKHIVYVLALKRATYFLNGISKHLSIFLCERRRTRRTRRKNVLFVEKLFSELLRERLQSKTSPRTMTTFQTVPRRLSKRPARARIAPIVAKRAFFPHSCCCCY